MTGLHAPATPLIYHDWLLSRLQAKLVITELRTRMRPRQPDDEVPTVSSVLVAGMRELAGASRESSSSGMERNAVERMINLFHQFVIGEEKGTKVLI